MTTSQLFKEKDKEYQLAYASYMSGSMGFEDLKKIERERSNLLSKVKKEIKKRVNK
jgi:hypothetical protein